MELKNYTPFLFRKLTHDDFAGLSDYLQHLSDETKKRFGPHQFDTESIASFYESQQVYTGYLAIDETTAAIAAYSIVKTGYLAHDNIRLQQYGLILHNNTDCTFAPSVADKWQGHGIGTGLFQFILNDVKNRRIKRIILWGGVQADNDIAVRFYKKNGFITLGGFEYNGMNLDMMLEIM